jgi:hypothetical protein
MIDFQINMKIINTECIYALNWLKTAIKVAVDLG